LVLTAFAYRLISGNVAHSEDKRIAPCLTDDERNLVLAEMRQFLIMIRAVSEGDY
jgi:hypothetical protein